MRPLAACTSGVSEADTLGVNEKSPARLARAELGGETYSPFFRGRDHSSV